MRRLLMTWLCCLPAVALAQSLGEPLVGSRNVVNAGPGDQSDPHVSEGLVAYTSEVQGLSEIRYHQLSTGQDQAIPNGGAYDFVADVSGDTVVFTRVSEASSIFAFNVRTQAPAVEVAPQGQDLIPVNVALTFERQFHPSHPAVVVSTVTDCIR